jgi:acetyl esterase
VPVDPQIAGLISILEQQGTPSLAAGSVTDARAGLTAMAGMLAAAFPDGVRTPVGAVRDVTIAGLPCRVYSSSATPVGPVPTTVMFHGGGFVIGDLETHDDQARLIAAGSGGTVVSVDYRLAPEATYPAAPDDCEAVTRYVLDHLEEFGGDPARVGVAGDSAGGNLSAVVAQRLRDRPAAHPLTAQLLWYPAVDCVDDEGARYPSRVENAEGYFLTAGDMRWFMGHYLGDDSRAAEPGASPLRGDLTGLPPAVVATAEFDPLRDEGEAYAAALEKAGVHVVATRYDGLIHGFVGMGVLSAAAQAATDETIAAYAALLS